MKGISTQMFLQDFLPIPTPSLYSIAPSIRRITSETAEDKHKTYFWIVMKKIKIQASGKNFNFLIRVILPIINFHGVSKLIYQIA